MTSNIKEELEFVVNHRRHLHQHPELSMEEFETTNYIINVLESLDVTYYRVLDTGVIAELKGSSDKVLGFRADIDALPIQEENDVSYKSQVKNVMHACGHDGHTTALLLFIKRLKALSEQGQLKHNCVFIFQPSEESNAGANLLINAWENRPDFDAIFGIHLMPDEAEGTAHYKDDELTASANEFHFFVEGTSSHVAQKHQGKSALEAIIKIASEVATIQQFHLDGLNRNIIHMGEMSAGEAINTVPSSAELRGTIRTYEEEDLAIIKTIMAKIKETAELLYGVTVRLEYNSGYPAVRNNGELKTIVETSLKDAGIEAHEKDKPYLFGEDFSFYSTIAPTYFVFMGSRNIDQGFLTGLHTNTFNFDEKVLIKVADYYQAILNNY